jgi:hypothetical protein
MRVMEASSGMATRPVEAQTGCTNSRPRLLQSCLQRHSFHLTPTSEVIEAASLKQKNRITNYGVMAK